MPTAELVRDRTLDTLDTARARAEDLVASVRDHTPDVDVPAVDTLVQRAAHHKLRTALIVSAVLLLLVLLVRKAGTAEEEPVPPSG